MDVKRVCTAHLFPLDDFRIAPQIFQIIESPGIAGEQVGDNIDKINEHPLLTGGAGFGAGGEIRFIAKFHHVIANAAHLPGAGAGGDDEKISDRRNRGDIQNHHV